jgi:hypothetical protein
MRPIFKAHATPYNGWWAITVNDVLNSTINTQARRLDRIEAMARDAIALGLEVPADSFDVEVSFTIDDVLQELITEARLSSLIAQEAQTTAAKKTKAAVKVLHKQGFSTRDSGTLIGLSAQRISQLLAQ